MREERTSKLRETFLKHRRLPFFQDLADYVHTLRPSDRLVFGILSAIVCLTTLISVLALEQKILIVEPAYGGTLTEGDVGSPRFINPLLAQTDTDQDLTALTYAGLMGIGPNGTLVPVLAQSYIESPDGKTYQFTIRSTARFSDGTPVTADDVVFTVQKTQDAALKSPQAVDWSDVTATALDAHTVQFTLGTPYEPFLYNTTLGILPAHLWRNVTDAEFPFSDLEAHPVGAGPFVTSKIARDSNGNITSYNLAANTRYVLGRPYLDGFVFHFYVDQPSLQTAVSKHAVESAYGVTSTTVLTAPFARVFAIFFNVSSGVFASQPVREALSLAINRPDIIKNVFGNYATGLTGPVPPDSGIDITASTTNDGVTAATTALTNAGWTYSSGTQSWMDSKGNTLSVTLKTSNVSELKVLAEAIQADWTQLHVQTTIQYYEPGDLGQEVIRPRSFQALLFGMVIGKDDDLYDFWDSKEAADPGLNITGYSNTAVDKLLADLRTQNDPVTRQQDLTQINQLISADYPAAFIESPDFVYAVPKDLKGVILPQITAPSDRFANVASWYRRTESVWPFLARS